MTSQTAQEIACDKAWDNLKYEGVDTWEVNPWAMFDAGWQAAQADQAATIAQLDEQLKDREGDF